jgi:putative oxidoreductase
LRRLFSTFAHGWPGVGLLLMRLAVGVSLIANGIQKLQTGQPIELAILNLLAVGDGALLVAGLWTPVAGFFVPVLAVWGLLIQSASLCPIILLATIGMGLALVGPGALSLDAWLFGWKKIDIEG